MGVLYDYMKLEWGYYFSMAQWPIWASKPGISHPNYSSQTDQAKHGGRGYDRKRLQAFG